MRQYFRDRKAWLIEPDDPNSVLVSYDSAPIQPMTFVPLGAPAIESIRDPKAIELSLRREVGADARSCDQWNALFARQTGVAGPALSEGCTADHDRTRAASFDEWFRWLLSAALVGQFRQADWKSAAGWKPAPHRIETITTPEGSIILITVITSTLMTIR